MAKAYASITITSLNDGASGKNSDEVRYIYIKSSAGNKPSKPSGTSQTVPDGWSLFPPSRGDGDTIYVSMAITTYSQDNIATYGSWSYPVAWTGEYIPFVQWKWGASLTVNPDDDVSVVTVGNSIITYGDTAFAYTVNTAEWSSTIPDRVEGCPYLWKRELDYSTNTWLYYCVQGGNGLSGRYMSIGYKVTGGNSITFSGLDQDGLPNLNAIQLSVNGENIILPSNTFTITESHSRYVLVAVWDDTGIGGLRLCYLNPYSDGTNYRIQWIDEYNYEISEGYALADIKISSAEITDVNMFNPKSIREYENAYFMSIMNDSDISDINVVAKALDVERVFEKVAALKAFINKLFANDIELTDSSGIKGSIHSKDYSKGSYVNKQGFFLDSSGYMELSNAILKDIILTSYNADGSPLISTSKGYDGFSFSQNDSPTHWKVPGRLKENGIVYNFDFSNIRIYLGTKYLYTRGTSYTLNYYYSFASDYDITIETAASYFNFSLTATYEGTEYTYSSNYNAGGDKHTIGPIHVTSGTSLSVVIKATADTYPSFSMYLYINDFVFSSTAGEGTSRTYYYIRYGESESIENTRYTDIYLSDTLYTDGFIPIEYDLPYGFGMISDYYPYKPDNNAIDNLITKTNKLIEYKCTSSSISLYKKNTYNVSKFIVNDDNTIGFTSEDGEYIEVDPSKKYAYSLTINAEDGTGSINLKNVLPIDNDSSIGAKYTPFNTAYINTLIGNVNQEGDTTHRVWGAVAN